MGVPPLPRDPNQPQPTQPVQQPAQPYTGPMPPPPPQPQVVYVPAPAPVPVHAKRGMSAGGHGFNWMLTLFTCGMWLPMYWGWWATVRCWQAWKNHRNKKKYYKVYG